MIEVLVVLVIFGVVIGVVKLMDSILTYWVTARWMRAYEVSRFRMQGNHAQFKSSQHIHATQVDVNPISPLVGNVSNDLDLSVDDGYYALYLQLNNYELDKPIKSFTAESLASRIDELLKQNNVAVFIRDKNGVSTYIKEYGINSSGQTLVSEWLGNHLSVEPDDSNVFYLDVVPRDTLVCVAKPKTLFERICYLFQWH